jgi:hypothetical protein
MPPSGAYAMPSMYSPHDGIAPFWNLGLLHGKNAIKRVGNSSLVPRYNMTEILLPRVNKSNLVDWKKNDKEKKTEALLQGAGKVSNSTNELVTLAMKPTMGKDDKATQKVILDRLVTRENGTHLVQEKSTSKSKNDSTSRIMGTNSSASESVASNLKDSSPLSVPKTDTITATE